MLELEMDESADSMKAVEFVSQMFGWEAFRRKCY